MVTVAACGSSGTAGNAGHGSVNHQLAASRCMRAHGVPNFPDPRKGPHGSEGLTVLFAPNTPGVSIGGITFNGPEFEAAAKACRFFGGGHAGPPVPEQQQRTMLAFARCMREHGIASYADPQFPPGGGIFGGGVSGGYNQNSPAFKRAASICNRATPSPSGG